MINPGRISEAYAGFRPPNSGVPAARDKLLRIAAGLELGTISPIGAARMIRNIMPMLMRRPAKRRAPDKSMGRPSRSVVNKFFAENPDASQLEAALYLSMESNK